MSGVPTTIYTRSNFRAALFLSFLCQWCCRRLNTNCTWSVYSFLKWAASFKRVSGELSSAAGGCCHRKAELELSPQSAAVALDPHCVSLSWAMPDLELQLFVSAAPTAGFLWQPTEYNNSHHETLRARHLLHQCFKPLLPSGFVQVGMSSY
jgi:hypothetical protein